VGFVLVVHRQAPGQYHWKALALMASEMSSRAFASVSVVVPAYASSAFRVMVGISPPKKFVFMRSTAAAGEPARYCVVSIRMFVVEFDAENDEAKFQRGTMLPAQYSILSG